jgi:hypothetical protein
MPRAKKPPAARYLVFDDLAAGLPTYPIYVPLPAALAQALTEAGLRAFTLATLEELMRLRCFQWQHGPADVVIDGFTARNDKIYPSFST